MLFPLDGSKKDSSGKGFTRTEVRDMVKAYRKSTTAKPLKYAHFPVQEVLDLFIANGVLDPQRPIASQTSRIAQHGIKIYLALNPADPTRPSPYHGKVTTLLCNTDITSGKLIDMLTPTKSVATKSVDPGQAIDQAEISPPYHENPGDDTADEDANNIP